MKLSVPSLIFRTFTGLLIVILSVGCGSDSNKEAKSGTPEKDSAQWLIKEAIQSHGGKKAYESLHVQFDFRKASYRIRRDGDTYRYVKTFVDSSGRTVREVLTNKGYMQYINGELQSLDEEKEVAYRQGLNSVAYFAMLPYRLTDKAVIAHYEGIDTVKGKPHHRLKVGFQKQGGGADHQDKFMYWFDKKEKKLRYLAYSYQRDGGGIRFRQAIAYMEADSVTFVNYRNYKPSQSLPLHKLDEAFEQGKLEHVSNIINKNFMTLDKAPE